MKKPVKYVPFLMFLSLPAFVQAKHTISVTSLDGKTSSYTAKYSETEFNIKLANRGRLLKICYTTSFHDGFMNALYDYSDGVMPMLEQAGALCGIHMSKDTYHFYLWINVARSTVKKISTY